MKYLFLFFPLFAIILGGCTSKDEEIDEVHKIVFEEEKEEEWSPLQKRAMVDGQQETLFQELDQDPR